MTNTLNTEYRPPAEVHYASLKGWTIKLNDDAILLNCGLKTGLIVIHRGRTIILRIGFTLKFELAVDG